MRGDFRTRLTLAFGGSIGLVLIAMSVMSFLFIRQTAEMKVRDDLHAAAVAQQRLWASQEQVLQEKASTLALDFGFRAAVATEDLPTIGSALANLKSRLGVDTAYVILPDGRSVPSADADRQTIEQAPPAILKAVESGERPSGVIRGETGFYQVVSAPIKAPRLVGWVVFAMPLDDAQLAELETLSAIPLSARFSSERVVEPKQSKTIISSNEVPGFGDLPSAYLVLSYPMARAMAPYNGMFVALLVTTIGGLIILLLCCWAVARSVTGPIRLLDAAVRQFGETSIVDVSINSDDEIGRLAGSFRSMAGRIAEREARITALSLTDTDSDLPNRRALEKAILELPSHHHSRYFVLAVSIDRFTRIQNTIGQVATNALVSMVGHRIAETGKVFAYGRIGSDRMALVVRADDAGQAEDVFHSLKIDDDPFRVGTETVDVHVTGGYARLDEDHALSAIDLAAIAIGQARDAGRKVQPFDAEAYGDPSGTLSMMSELMLSLDDGTVSLVYQPKFDVRTQKITGVEALLRWIHPVRGFVPPDIFVGNAEETGHIRPLTCWVVSKVIEEHDRLARNGYELKFAINLSGRLLTDDSFTDWVIETISKSDGKYCLEVTETAVIDDPQQALANIDKLRKAGIEISIDDYGAGLSSLSYLKQIPAHELKIDKAFVLSMQEGSSDALLVKSTIDLAHSLGLRVVAEGVETTEVLSLLAIMGADVAQGYYISRPLKPADLETFLRAEAVRLTETDPKPAKEA